MAVLPVDEKMRILEARAKLTSEGTRKSWGLVAVETHHAKKTVIEVNRWFQELPWEVIKALPEGVQRLRNDYLDYLKERRNEGLSKDDVFRPIPEVWPHGFFSGDKKILRGETAKRWSTDRPQQTGDDFTLDLGQEFPLHSVRFLQGPEHQWDRPKLWKVVLSDETKIVCEIESDGFIEFELEETVEIRRIGVIILQPRMPTDLPPATCWAVDNIELT